MTKQELREEIQVRDLIIKAQNKTIKELEKALILCNGKLNKAGVRCSMAEEVLKTLGKPPLR